MGLETITILGLLETALVILCTLGFVAVGITTFVLLVKKNQGL
jgi:hypothetical protein